ncbi:MAG: sporulation protein YabP [Angelakisella sp.]
MIDNTNKPMINLKHTVIMEDRKHIQITGVTDVESFDEQTVVLMTQPGELLIKGNGLHITRIDVATGDLALDGEIDELSYGDSRPSGGLLSRLFR